MSLLSRADRWCSSRRRSELIAQLRPGVDGVILAARRAPRHLPAAGLGAAARSGAVPREPQAEGRPPGGHAPHPLPGVALPGPQVEGVGPQGRTDERRRRVEVSRPLVAHARRRPHPVRPVPARLPAARGPARRLLRAHARRRPDGADHLRPLVGLLHRPDREEAAQPLLSRASRILSFGTAGCNLACKFCQNWDISKSREMDTLDGPGHAGDDRARRRASSAARASRSPTTTR